jgi:hypothetical protein
MRQWAVAAAVILAAGLWCAPAEAGITWVSQNRYAGYGIYAEPTAYGRSLGDIPGYGTPTKSYVASGFGPFSAPVGIVSLSSDIDTTANVMTARGGGDSYLTPIESLNQYTYYQYAAVHVEATFRLAESTPYSVTIRPLIGTTRSNLKLLGPGGQTIAFTDLPPKNYEGVLGAGDWTVLATGAPGGVDEGSRFDFTVALPEPSVGMLALGVAAVGACRRLRRGG